MPVLRILMAVMVLAVLLYFVLGKPLIVIRTLLPAPWLIPKNANGSALRMAMIHDVLHERFLVHGPAWFEHRHVKTARLLAEYDDGTKAKDQRYFDLLDDYAVDFDRLGRPAEGVPILRSKLDLQQPLGSDGIRPPPKGEFYTTYANLGTLLAHVHLKGALAKDPAALAGLKEGLSFIEQSMAVNPDAHFGREVWQAVALRYLLHAIDHPAVMTQVDIVGLRWDELGRHSLPTNRLDRSGLKALVESGEFQRLAFGPRSADDDKLVARFREAIPRVESRHQAFIEHCLPPNSGPITFDQPALALVGIWTLGSGANPHFALAFAHLMEGLDQPDIAWNAYERAGEMASRFWPEPAIQKALSDHCREQQTILERRLKTDRAVLRKRHRAELAFGRAEQQAYQGYETEHIAAGRDPDAADFYENFIRSHSPIASDPGNADTVLHEQPLSTVNLILVIQAFVCSMTALVLTDMMINRGRRLPA